MTGRRSGAALGLQARFGRVAELVAMAIANRRSFDEELSRELERVTRTHGAAALLGGGGARSVYAKAGGRDQTVAAPASLSSAEERVNPAAA